MFKNLIESSSHAEELKRRGSFFLFTTAVYLALFAITGVVSIYAYDAHLERQSTELELLTMWPVERPPEQSQPEVVRNAPGPASFSANNSNSVTHPTRTAAVDSTSNPNNTPDEIGTTPSPALPWTRGAVIDITNTDGQGPGGSYRGSGEGTGNTTVIEIPDPPPPPQRDPPPVTNRIVRSPRVLNSQAISLPRPNYPPLARQLKREGVVTIQVLIDETGKVISAEVLSGDPLLIHAAKRAALQARFSPTMIGDVAVKVSGVITYKFELQ